MILAARKLERKLTLKQRRYEIDQLMKEKRSEEMEVLEEVFDKSTLMIIYQMLNKGDLKKIFGVIKSGKESRVYWGIGSNNRDVAVKIYLTTSAEFKRGMLPYIEGDPRFTRTYRDSRSLVYLWAQKEYKNLKLARDAGVRVPKPIVVKGNVLLMEFIGEKGTPAPLLKEVELKNPLKMYRQLLNIVRLLYQRSMLVHGDLSEYNIMLWDEEPILFDLSQAVMVSHPSAEFFLKRDLENLNQYFLKQGIEVKPIDEVYRWVAGHGS